VLHNRTHWAKFYLTKAELLSSPRHGRFAITDAGRAVVSAPPSKLDTNWLFSIEAFRAFYDGTHIRQATQAASRGPDLPASASTPEETIDATYDAIQRTLKQELLERILQNSPAFFERLIVDLLVAMGYGGTQADAATHLGKSGDGGVDGVINEDALGLDRVYVQAKRYNGHVIVGRPAVQTFVGSLVGLGASKGVFVTTSSFSSQAIEFAAALPQRLVLIDGERLTDLLLLHSVGLRTSRVLNFRRLDEDYFAEE
jgi:restriction system protein